MPQIEPFPEIEVRCDSCNLNKIYQSNAFTEEALQFLNGKSIGLLYFKFKCEECKENASLYTEENLLFNKNNLSYCQIGFHPIPKPQLDIIHNRSNCVHCAQEYEDQVDLPALVPLLVNSKPCPTCKNKREEDPERFAHRTGTTEIRLNNTTRAPYICCSLYPQWNPGGCIYSRSINEEDEIQNREINTARYVNINLFKEGYEIEAKELQSEEMQLGDVLEEIENKFGELKGLIEDLRELIDTNRN